MRNVIVRAVEITKASLRVLQQHPRLMALPTMSFLTFIPFMFGLSILFSHYHAALVAHWWTSALILLPFVFGMTLIITFFNVAFTRAVMRTLRDEEPSVLESLAFASTKWRVLVGYSAIASTVGLLFSLVERYSAKLGGFIAEYFFQFSWSLATFLIVPVIAQEQRNLGTSLRRSGQLMTQTWGERVLGQLGLTAVFLAPVAAIIALGYGAFRLRHEALAPAIALGGIAALGFVVFGALSWAVRALYAIALYQFAVEGVPPSEFGSPALDDVWKVR
jgi:Family of unknown function (DUF6159)